MAVYLSRTGFDPMVVSWIGTALAVGYAAYVTYTTAKANDTSGASTKTKGNRINTNVKQDEPKVVDTFDLEDLGNKSVFCRCWKSKKFPYCDGAHANHNKECGDNIGPLIVQRREAKPVDS